ncbi:hypothetical protein KBZ00_25785 [Streptomyces sp. RK31]|uniref:hypothetical protein n=1 Tax=Streptomyces sp. RK31 TaxID=2824892 RepID=UPI001B3602EE|nr:hypothetical protein [Streptomyces sp. RK31]MBQ0974511.1 hypothetical protein [Streptomyces sp. RK31]
MSEPTSKKPPLSFETRVDELAGVLRVDQIRTDTLVQLVQHWKTDPEARQQAIATLDDLADVVASPRLEGALDAAVEAVEEAAAMDAAQLDVDVSDVRRLLGELQRVAARVGRFARRVPGQRGAA